MHRVLTLWEADRVVFLAVEQTLSCELRLDKVLARATSLKIRKARKRVVAFLAGCAADLLGRHCPLCSAGTVGSRKLAVKRLRLFVVRRNLEPVERTS